MNAVLPSDLMKQSAAKTPKPPTMTCHNPTHQGRLFYKVLTACEGYQQSKEG